MDASDRDRRFLQQAARLAVRGHGGAEPNPLVGCVLVDDADTVVGAGFHARCGGPHAEIVALGVAGRAAAGSTAYVTLEPCNHVGRTGPCSAALIDAGVRRVVIARRDPFPAAAGGVERLREAGIEVDLVECPDAAAVAAPFVRRVLDGRPWVTVKWAQTLDGRIAGRDGESQWISGPRSRRLVHRERGRVDVVLTGIGTVEADDPMLTARGVRRRRVARRVVVDPRLRIELGSRLVRSVGEAPLTIAHASSVAGDRRDHASALADRGVEVIPIDDDRGELPIRVVLEELVRRHAVTHVLVEAGGRLVGRLLRDRLVDELAVFVAPLIVGDEHARAAVTGLDPPRLADALRLSPLRVHRRGRDVLLRYAAPCLRRVSPV